MNPTLHFNPIRHISLLMGTLFLILCFLPGCGKKNRLEVDTTAISVSPEYHHFEEVLFNIPDTLFTKQFPGIYPEFAPLFMMKPLDTITITEMLIFRTEPRFIDLFNEKKAVIGDMQAVKKEIEQVLKHYRFYYPDAPEHQIFTHISGIDMSLLNSPLILNDTIVIISSDLFLGRSFEPYEMVGIPYYKRFWMEPSQIAPEFARQLAFLKAGSPDEAETLLDQMILQGKILYFMDAMMPEADDSLKIKYTSQQLKWCKEHQRDVWAYMINNKMLYASDQNHSKLMILDGPFTAAFTESSPGRLGHWFGWQIVKKYMEKHPELTVSDLMKEPDSQRILSDSGYKPR